MLYVNPMEVNGAALAEKYKAGIGRAGAAQDPEREKTALAEYEHLFLFQLLQEMRKTIPQDTLFGKSGEKDYMDEMLDDHNAGVMAKSGQFGIAKQMEAQMHAHRHVEDFGPVEFKALSGKKHT